MARTHHHARATKHTKERAVLKKVAACETPNPAKTVLIVKQWHLAPTTVTKGFREKYPQERNQTAIFRALADKIKAKKLQLVVAEGCEGEINADFKTAFNGWDYQSLHKISQTRNYDKILTSVPLKLEARYTDKIRTLCGDDAKLIREGNLRLSNLRGWMGFWTRLHETYVDDKGKLYADTASDLLKIPRSTPVDKILSAIRGRLKDEITAFDKSLAARNDAFVKVLRDQDFETAAVVVGGLHALDLKTKLQAAGLGCEVLEPPGYQAQNEELLGEFEKAVADPPAASK
jgi:hypothetical protein